MGIRLVLEGGHLTTWAIIPPRRHHTGQECNPTIEIFHEKVGNIGSSSASFSIYMRAVWGNLNPPLFRVWIEREEKKREIGKIFEGKILLHYYPHTLHQ